MGQERYTFKAAWVAEAAKGDFKKMEEIRSGIQRRVNERPTRKVVVSTIVQHIFDNLSATQLAAYYADAHEIHAAEMKAKQEAEEAAKKDAEILELEARLAALRGK